MVISAWRLVVFVSFGLAGLLPGQASAKCEDIIPRAVSPVEPSRLVTPEDIVRLRDIGEREASGYGKGPLAVSPDGKRLAFVIARAEIATNDYCRALVVLDLRPGARPMIVDRGGDYMKMTASVRGLMVSPGAAEAVTPYWSPDGQSIAYRKQLGGRTEAWVARADGGGARSVARLPSDIEDIAWTGDGTRLLLASRPGLAAQREALSREALSGYLYDDRFQPAYQMEPLPTAAPLEAVSVDLASGVIAAVDAAETARLFPEFGASTSGKLEALSNSGRRAQLLSEGSGVTDRKRVAAQDANGRIVRCAAKACAGSISALSWVGDLVTFRRLEGWARGTYSLYRWKPGQGAPRRILSGEELLYGCHSAEDRIVCLIESANSPAKLESIDPATGRRTLLFDPNPEFRAIRLGEVRRLKVRNALGIEAWGDLVLPPDYRGGRIPLVVVQYRSRGFLRGGVGSEYPIHAFASHGMAVLSFERPDGIGEDAKTEAQLLAANSREWADRRSVQDALELAIDEAIRIGVADPMRIGMTGLSDGSTTIAFALINSRIKIAAAAMSSCCAERESVNLSGGPRYAEHMKAQGYPPPGSDDREFWAPMSVAQNAARIDTPILMLHADREYALGLETWAALKAAGKPVEMYVYPDEYHNKWQPAHLEANYVRSLDWFDFWLLDRRDPGPGKAAQYHRWDELKRLRDHPQ